MCAKDKQTVAYLPTSIKLHLACMYVAMYLHSTKHRYRTTSYVHVSTDNTYVHTHFNIINAFM